MLKKILITPVVVVAAFAVVVAIQPSAFTVKMIAPEFEKGLAQMKAVAERTALAKAKG